MSSKQKQTKRKSPLVEVAYQEIYRRIVSLTYKPGQALEEKMLMAHLEIGRTPVREALFRLSTEFLVESQPQKGFVVRPITLQSVKAMFEALKILELGAAALAVRQDISEFLPELEGANAAIEGAVEANDHYGLVESNHKFHMAFARCSRNAYIVRGMHEVRCEANRLAYLSFSHEIEGAGASLRSHYASVVSQHREFIERLTDRDKEGLETLICKHIRAFQMRVVEYLTA